MSSAFSKASALHNMKLITPNRGVSISAADFEMADEGWGAGNEQ